MDIYEMPFEIQYEIKKGMAIDEFISKSTSELEEFVSQFNILDRILMFVNPISDTKPRYDAAKQIIAYRYN